MLTEEEFVEATALYRRGWSISAIARHLGQAEAAAALFEVVQRRYLKGSIILTTNRGIASWGQIFDDPMIAAAMLDRCFTAASSSGSTARATGCAPTAPKPSGCEPPREHESRSERQLVELEQEAAELGEALPALHVDVSAVPARRVGTHAHARGCGLGTGTSE